LLLFRLQLLLLVLQVATIAYVAVAEKNGKLGNTELLLLIRLHCVVRCNKIQIKFN